MPSLSLTARSLALAGLGLGAAPAFAQSANVTAFNPYNGVGAPSAPSVSAMPQGGPAGGPAFNPWNPGSNAGWGGGVSAGPSTGSSSSYAGGSSYYSPGANLPAPPPGPIESRLTAVPDSRATTRNTTPVRAATVAPAPEPVVTRATPPAPTSAPTPTPIQAKAPVVAAAPPPAPVAVAPTPAHVAPAPAPAKTVVASAPATPVVTAPAAASAAQASITFGPQSAEISGTARTDLERAAQNMKGVRQIELRAYASGSDPTEARKIALARALSVRSYLIDQGIRGRIEVGAFASSAGGANGERVDIISQ